MRQHVDPCAPHRPARQSPRGHPVCPRSTDTRFPNPLHDGGLPVVSTPCGMSPSPPQVRLRPSGITVSRLPVAGRLAGEPETNERCGPSLVKTGAFNPFWGPFFATTPTRPTDLHSGHLSGSFAQGGSAVLDESTTIPSRPRTTSRPGTRGSAASSERGTQATAAVDPPTSCTLGWPSACTR